MPGLDTDIVVHKLPLRPECPPIKQKLRRTRPDMALKIREEVRKQFDAGFLAVARYPEWIANIVPVPKKDWGFILLLPFSFKKNEKIKHKMQV